MNGFVDEPAAVREGEELDLGKLQGFLARAIPEASGELTVQQFPQGYSNLTYLLKMGSLEMVLRRPPFGNEVKSAHDMSREHRVLSKLCEVYSLAPRPLAYCEDDSVLGAPFYVMERRHGIILRKRVPEGLDLSPNTMRQLSESFVDNLARLHAIDYEAVGLGKLGKPDGFVERQVSGWTKRYERAATDEIADMLSVADWLAQNRPTQSDAALIHNDYKYDNIVLDANDPTQILAVLDWEMCTLGDPLLDLGCALAYWVQADDDTRNLFNWGPTDLPGNLTRQEFMDRYAQKTGRDLSQILFFYCFGLFKLAVIVQQIYFRYAKGLTRDQRFAQLNHVVANLSRAAMTSIDRNRV